MDRIDEIDLALNKTWTPQPGDIVSVTEATNIVVMQNLGEEAVEMARTYHRELAELKGLAKQVTDAWFNEEKTSSLRDFTNSIARLRELANR